MACCRGLHISSAEVVRVLFDGRKGSLDANVVSAAPPRALVPFRFVCLGLLAFLFFI